MAGLFDIAALAAAALGVIGIGQTLAGWVAVRRFGAADPPRPSARPAVTILKPLHGDEALLEQALASFCVQDYPSFQIVFGVQDPADAALPAVERLRTRFPRMDIAVVVDPTRHGVNLKVGNLINMSAAARHDVLLISDSDIHVRPDYLARVAAALEEPETGLVTTLYTGLPGSGALAARLGATQISHGFLPGALLARAMGRQDCLGATMALRRDTLARIGGLAAVADELADDAVLGRLVARAGLRVALARTVPATTVPEADLGALWRHELRWGRTIRSLVPVQFALSVLQYPIFWTGLALALSGMAEWALVLFLAAWLARAAAARGVDRALGLASAAPIWLLPVRDLLSVAVILASHGGRRVQWRGQALQAIRPKLASKQRLASEPRLASEKG